MEERGPKLKPEMKMRSGLRPSEVAKILGIPYRTALRLIKAEMDCFQPFPEGNIYVDAESFARYYERSFGRPWTVEERKDRCGE